MKKLKHQLKRHSFGMAIICILLAAAAVFGGFSVFAQQRAEQSVTNFQDRSQETLFKNYIYSAETVKTVCDKYDLDYDTVTERSSRKPVKNIRSPQKMEKSAILPSNN